jgi:hypothetical protein
MTALETFATIFQYLGFVALYLFLGFGPGFLVGMLLANRLAGRGKQSIFDSHIESKKEAAQHNAQWHPTNERWQ